ncbi:hypothetical protein SAMD00023353_3800980 [Rosellinia necatrix]|uniref:Uncharacterized protein n=1 Tax=Rosellinia necatrix TaxID=77044 RepID=A0A1S8A989_ROSNE|nr:hypothetical protein SAMD00023353_3800980 [Rosellinia necatrix]
MARDRLFSNITSWLGPKGRSYPVSRETLIDRCKKELARIRWVDNPEPSRIPATGRLAINTKIKAAALYLSAMLRWLDADNKLLDERTTTLGQDRAQDCHVLRYYLWPGSFDCLLPRAAEFRRDEARRAKQRFTISPDEDLVYIADPRHPELFAQLIQCPWFEEIERVAILILDFSVLMNWPDRERGISYWGDEALSFKSTKLKEVMLVVRPVRNPINTHCERQPRDVYGFIDICKDVFYGLDSWLEKDWSEVSLDLLSYETNLRLVFGDLMEDVQVRFVADVDCEAIGVASRDNSLYWRLRHGRSTSLPSRRALP